LIKIVQKRLNKSIANRTITKQETVCQLAKLPLVICSEQIDIISLSKAVKYKKKIHHIQLLFYQNMQIE
jgi:hypothetical protein